MAPGSHVSAVPAVMPSYSRKGGQEPERQEQELVQSERHQDPVSWSLVSHCWGYSHAGAEAGSFFPTHTCTHTNVHPCCTHTYTHLQIYTHAQIQMCAHAWAHTHAHTCIHMHTQMCTHAVHIHTPIKHKCAPVLCTHKQCTHKQMCSRANAHTHTCTQTHAYSYQGETLFRS